MCRPHRRGSIERPARARSRGRASRSRNPRALLDLGGAPGNLPGDAGAHGAAGPPLRRRAVRGLAAPARRAHGAGRARGRARAPVRRAHARGRRGAHGRRRPCAGAGGRRPRPGPVDRAGAAPRDERPAPRRRVGGGGARDARRVPRALQRGGTSLRLPRGHGRGRALAVPARLGARRAPTARARAPRRDRGGDRGRSLLPRLRREGHRAGRRPAPLHRGRRAVGGAGAAPRLPRGGQPLPAPHGTLPRRHHARRRAGQAPARRHGAPARGAAPTTTCRPRRRRTRSSSMRYVTLPTSTWTPHEDPPRLRDA
jgi:hypothetical protein